MLVTILTHLFIQIKGLLTHLPTSFYQQTHPLPKMNVNFNMPDFKNLKSTLHRVVQVNSYTQFPSFPYNPPLLFTPQLTEEKLGTSERTELDSHLENLVERAECSRNWTEKIVKNSESVLIPNPGNRVEDYIFEKIEKKKPTRLSNLEYLGQDMIEVNLRI